MSAMALTNATDPAVRTLAYDVLTTQQGQWGTMQGWLAVWDRPLQAAGEPMTWMRATEDSAGTAAGMTEHAAMPPGSAIQGPRMPGMATTSELDTLRRTTGPAFDTLYLQLLLRHHQAACRWHATPRPTPPNKWSRRWPDRSPTPSKPNRRRCSNYLRPTAPHPYR